MTFKFFTPFSIATMIIVFSTTACAQKKSTHAPLKQNGTISDVDINSHFKDVRQSDFARADGLIENTVTEGDYWLALARGRSERPQPDQVQTKSRPDWGWEIARLTPDSDSEGETNLQLLGNVIRVATPPNPEDEITAPNHKYDIDDKTNVEGRRLPTGQNNVLTRSTPANGTQNLRGEISTKSSYVSCQDGTMISDRDVNALCDRIKATPASCVTAAGAIHANCDGVDDVSKGKSIGQELLNVPMGRMIREMVVPPNATEPVLTTQESKK